MSCFTIVGGKRVGGTIAVQGAKNSILPILSATLLCNTPCIIHNCPKLSDVDVTIKILQSLGATAEYKNSTVFVDPTGADKTVIPHELMRCLRSSVVFFGSMLARFGQADICMPGGCELGLRPINIHVDALKKMNAEIFESGGRLIGKTRGLKSAVHDLPIASVGATENIILAAVTAEGTTVIRNAAKEPEIVDLCEFLRRCGAKISGDGTAEINIDGVDELRGCEHTVIADRIATATYLCAAAITGGSITVKNTCTEHLVSVLPCFEQMGCRITADENRLSLISPERLKRIEQVQTSEYPGFPTDAQPLLLALSTVADGTSVFVENIFSGRYKFVDGLIRLGAKIKVLDRVAIVEGVDRLYGANVSGTDLRGSAALVIGALAAKGTTKLTDCGYIDRGYEEIEKVLQALGANIIRE